eukprot:5426162-Amphidinium_carterae.1
MDDIYVYACLAFGQGVAKGNSCLWCHHEEMLEDLLLRKKGKKRFCTNRPQKHPILRSWHEPQRPTSMDKVTRALHSLMLDARPFYTSFKKVPNGCRFSYFSSVSASRTKLSKV